MKKLALIVILGAVVGLVPAAAASPTVRLTIMHFVQGCHVWGTATSNPLGPRHTVTLKRGAKIVIRVNCPMSFNFSRSPARSSPSATRAPMRAPPGPSSSARWASTA